MSDERASKFSDRTTKYCKGCERDLPFDAFYQRLEGRQYKTPYGRAMTPCKECRIALDRASKVDPERKRQIRAWNLMNKYGMTLEEHDQMSAEQGGACAICGQPPSETAARTQYLHVDHCHASGAIRALLCHKCNKGLGCFGDNPALLRKGAEYLEG